MDTIKRFFECLIPVTACNLKCGYCYVIQRNNRKSQLAKLKYTPKQIGDALTKERLGGTCYFSICGAGETTIQPQLEDIVFNILKNGHYVNITTNGTVTKRLNDIIEKNQQFTNHLHFSFSFHYNELIRLNLIDTFFNNINYIKSKGCSILVQFNMCDEYIPHLEEMKRLCIERAGAMPQIAATRKEETGLQKIELLTELTEDQYKKMGDSFNSPLFDFTMKNFNVKRKEFCYAGDWTGILDLSTGIMRRCYSSYIYQDIFKNPKKKIRFIAMGKSCGSPFCMNSSHFMSLGVIPEIETPTYAELRNRKEAGWYSENMNDFLSNKLKDNNKEYNGAKKFVINSIGAADTCIRKTYRVYKKMKG